MRVVEIFFVGLILVSGASLGITESVAHKFDRSLAQNVERVEWWQVNSPGDSWKNKWKDRNGNPDTREEAFFGSSTVFAFVTDAYHLFKFLCLACIFLAMSIGYRFEVFSKYKKRLWLAHWIVWYGLFQIGWYTTWSWLPRLIF